MKEDFFCKTETAQISFILSEAIGRFRDTQKWNDFYSKINGIRQYVEEVLLDKPHCKINEKILKDILKIAVKNISSGHSYLENDIEEIYKIFANLAKEKIKDFL